MYEEGLGEVESKELKAKLKAGMSDAESAQKAQGKANKEGSGN